MSILEPEVLDTTTKISDLVDSIMTIAKSTADPKPELRLFLDLEGVNLSREGTISIVTLLVDPGDAKDHRTYLIDVTTLGSRAFDTKGPVHDTTFKDVLQDPNIIKVLFDVRNDSDAMYSHYGVALENVRDIQLMENGARSTGRTYLCGLQRCIDESSWALRHLYKESGDTFREELIDRWNCIKQIGAQLFKPELGGGYEVFDQRPLSKAMVEYCVGDVVILPMLHDFFWEPRKQEWRDLIAKKSMERVEESQSEDYQPNGFHKAKSQWTWEEHAALNGLGYVRIDHRFDGLRIDWGWD